MNHFDPNVGAKSPGDSASDKLISWPRFNTQTKQMLELLDGDVPLDITKDDFREDAINYLIAFSLANTKA